MVKKFILALVFMFGLLAFAPAMAFDPLGNTCPQGVSTAACQQGGACQNSGANNGSSSAACQDAKGQLNNSGSNPIIKDLAETIRILSGVVGVAAIILVILGGLNFVTSGGNAENVANARKRITAALIGLALAALVYAIASFLVSKVL